jgi:hypothetical protein
MRPYLEGVLLSLPPPDGLPVVLGHPPPLLPPPPPLPPLLPLPPPLPPFDMTSSFRNPRSGCMPQDRPVAGPRPTHVRTKMYRLVSAADVTGRG